MPRRLTHIRSRVASSLPIVVLAGAFLAFCLVVGAPVGRALVLTWCIAAIVILTGFDVRRLAHGFVRDWIPFVGLLMAYELVRGKADELFQAHAQPQLLFDQVLGLGTVPTVWLQERFYDAGSVRWYDVAAMVTYLSHFWLSSLLAVGLFVYCYPAFRRFLWSYVTLTVMGVVTYALYPAIPPWMAADQGLVPHVTRTMRETFEAANVEIVMMGWELGSAYANPVAALPSMHAAYPALLLLLYRGRSRILDAVLAGYVLAMGLTLVYAGEHFVFDVVLGWAYAAVAVAIVERVRARRQRATAGTDAVADARAGSEQVEVAAPAADELDEAA